MSNRVASESIEHFLHNLGSAIDEARKVRSSIAAKNYDNRAIDRSARWRLTLVDREIELLESKLIKVRSRKVNS